MKATSFSNPISAFTLIELISVLGIMVFLMAIAVGSYFAWNQTTALRGATDLALSGLNRARQSAITHRVDTCFYTQNAVESTLTNRAFFVIFTNAADTVGAAETGTVNENDIVFVTPPQTLPVNVSFGLPDDIPNFIWFQSDGRVADNDLNTRNDSGEIVLDLRLKRGLNFATQTLLLDPLTGHARPAPREVEK